MKGRCEPPKCMGLRRRSIAGIVGGAAVGQASFTDESEAQGAVTRIRDSSVGRLTDLEVRDGRGAWRERLRRLTS